MDPLADMLPDALPREAVLPAPLLEPPVVEPPADDPLPLVLPPLVLPPAPLVAPPLVEPPPLALLVDPPLAPLPEYEPDPPMRAFVSMN